MPSPQTVGSIKEQNAISPQTTQNNHGRQRHHAQRNPDCFHRVLTRSIIPCSFHVVHVGLLSLRFFYTNRLAPTIGSQPENAVRASLMPPWSHTCFCRAPHASFANRAVHSSSSHSCISGPTGHERRHQCRRCPRAGSTSRHWPSRGRGARRVTPAPQSVHLDRHHR